MKHEIIGNIRSIEIQEIAENTKDPKIIRMAKSLGNIRIQRKIKNMEMRGTVKNIGIQEQIVENTKTRGIARSITKLTPKTLHITKRPKNQKDGQKKKQVLRNLIKCLASIIYQFHPILLLPRKLTAHNSQL